MIVVYFRTMPVLRIWADVLIACNFQNSLHLRDSDHRHPANEEKEQGKEEAQGSCVRCDVNDGGAEIPP